MTARATYAAYLVGCMMLIGWLFGLSVARWMARDAQAPQPVAVGHASSPSETIQPAGAARFAAARLR